MWQAFLREKSTDPAGAFKFVVEFNNGERNFQEIFTLSEMPNVPLDEWLSNTTSERIRHLNSLEDGSNNLKLNEAIPYVEEKAEEPPVEVVPEEQPAPVQPQPVAEPLDTTNEVPVQ